MRGSGGLVVVCGLAAEASIARAPGVTVIVGGGDGARLDAEVAAAARSAAGLLSFGVAGALASNLRPGDMRVAREVVGPNGRRFQADPAWTAAIAAKTGAPLVNFAGVDAPVADATAKAALGRRLDVATVDMESHIVARAAARHGLPFAALRVITDPAHRSLPHAATVGMRADGKVDLAAILRSLGKNPGQLPGLIRAGLDARAAFAALLRGRQLLGPRFALLDL